MRFLTGAGGGHRFVIGLALTGIAAHRRGHRGQRLDREREPLSLGIDREHAALHLRPLTDDVGDAPDVPCGQFGDVHETLDARLEPHERAELRDAGHRAADRRAHVIPVGGPLPRALDEVLGRQADLAGLTIDLLHDDANRVARLDHIGRIRHPFPGELAGVHEALDAVADVNERAEVAHAAHDPVERRARLERFEQFRAGIGRPSLDHRSPREHQPPRRGHELRHEGLHALPDHLLEILDPPRAHEARGHESAEASHVALETALVGRRDPRRHDHAGLELRPVLDRHRTVGRRHVVEVVVRIATADGDVDRLADLGQVMPLLEPAGELHGALPTATEIDERGVATDREDGAGEPRARLERCLDPPVGTGIEQLPDLEPGQRRLVVGLQIVVERPADARHRHPFGRREHVGRRRSLRGVAAAAATGTPGGTAGVARGRRRLRRGRPVIPWGGRLRQRRLHRGRRARGVRCG